MRALSVVLLLLVGGGGVWYATRDDDTPIRSQSERRGADDAPSERAQPSPQKPPAPKPDHTVAGTVVGDAPLGGVRISFEGGHSGETGEDGSYAFMVPPPSKTLIIHVEGKAQRSEQQPIKLAPASNVVLRAIAPSGEPVASAKIRIHHLISRPRLGPRKLPRVIENTTTDVEGHVERRLALGEYRIRAVADGFARVMKDFKLGDQPEEVELRFVAERQLKVLVRDTQAKEPVEGATVYPTQRYRDYGTPPVVTDAHGEALVCGLNPGDPVQVLVVPPGVERPRQGPGRYKHFKVPGDRDEMVVEIELPRTITWEVRDGDIPVPADGTTIAVKAETGSAATGLPGEGVMQEGRLVLRNCPVGYFHAIAHGPSGTGARLSCMADSTEGAPIQFKRLCNIDYVIRKPDGSPAPRTKIAIFNQGNNQLAEATTDAQGKARMEALSGQLAEIKLVGASSWQAIATLGTVDLRQGDIKVEFTLPARRAVELQGTIEGRPGLPEGYRFELGWFKPERPQADTKTGLYKAFVTLPHSMQAGGEITMSLYAPGYRTAVGQVVIPEGDGPLRHTFDLRPGLELRVREVGKRPLDLQLELQRDRGDHWQTIDSSGMLPRRQRRETEDGWAFVGLDAGRYRMRVLRHRLVLGAAEAGADPIVLDYNLLAHVRGRVELPEGFDYDDVRVGWDGTALRPHRETGEFDVMTVTGRAATLSATHPLLAPDAGMGSVTVHGGRDGVVLKLVRGPTLRFRIPEYFEQRPGERNGRTGVRVRLYADGKEIFSRVAKLSGQEWLVGGFAPGTYRAWIDVPHSVPVTRAGIVLKTGDNDLGELPMEKGATLRIRVLVNEPFVAPPIAAWAIRRAAPAFTRGRNSRGGNEVVVTGLVPGTYEIVAGPVLSMTGAGGNRIHKTIEIAADGADLTLDLR